MSDFYRPHRLLPGRLTFVAAQRFLRLRRLDAERCNFSMLGVGVRRWVLTVGLTVVVLDAALNVMTNLLFDQAPGWLADPVRRWLVTVVLILLLALLWLLTSRTGSSAAPIRALRSGVVVVTTSLRPPVLDVAVRGREAELAQLQALSVATGGRFGVICAAGGVGKTTLAAAAAAKAQELGRGVFWVRYRGVTDLASRLAEVAVATGLPATQLDSAHDGIASLPDLVWDHLNRVRGWVLVIDNLDQPSEAAPDGELLRHYRGWIRPSQGGLLLITSRDRHPDTWGPAAHRFTLDPLSPQAGAQLLCDLAPHAGSIAEAERLSVRLGGLPLALRAASALLAERTSRYPSFMAYREALDARTASLLPDRPDATDHATAQSLIGFTWELSLDQLAAEGVHLARDVLRLLAIFADAPIARSVISPRLLGEVVGEIPSAAALDAALAGLDRYGLIEVPEPSVTYGLPTVLVHSVVREAAVDLLERTGKVNDWRRAVSHDLIGQVEDAVRADRAGWHSALLLAPHLPILVEPHTPGELFQDNRNALDSVANMLKSAGFHRSELGLRQAVLDAETTVLGAEHSDTLTSRNNLALVLRALGHYEQAADLHRTTLAVRERTLGVDDPLIRASRNNLASTYHKQGRYQQAADLHRQNLDDNERTLGADHLQTLASRNNLAEALRALEEYEAAAELHLRTLTDSKRTYGSDHAQTLASRNNLGLALGALGRHQEAVDLHSRTHADAERALGVDHPQTLSSRNNLAQALCKVGQFERAAELHRRTLLARSRILGVEHPETLTSSHNLATTLQELGDLQQAVDLHRRTLADRERVLGPDHPDTHHSRQQLAAARTAEQQHERTRWWRRRRPSAPAPAADHSVA